MIFSEHDFLADYIFKTSDPVLIDVGANHGFFTLPFAQKGWQAVAFEPEKKNLAVLRKNLAAFPKVQCVAHAASDVTGARVPFYVSEEHYGIHSLKPFHPTHKPAYEVETERLDDALARLKISAVTLLKVDAEGADFLVLKGFDFQKYRPEVVVAEYMDDRSKANFGYTHHDVVRHLEQYNYATFISEWAPIKEYGREGGVSSHRWLRCERYPLDHEPLGWGNLIFVVADQAAQFEKSLQAHLAGLRALEHAEQREKKVEQWKRLGRKIPGAAKIYRALFKP